MLNQSILNKSCYPQTQSISQSDYPDFQQSSGTPDSRHPGRNLDALKTQVEQVVRSVTGRPLKKLWQKDRPINPPTDSRAHWEVLLLIWKRGEIFQT